MIEMPVMRPTRSIAPPGATKIRLELRVTERGLKAIGALYIVLGAIGAFGAGSVVASLIAGRYFAASVSEVLMFILLMIFGGIGIGLRRLAPAVRIPAAVAAALSLPILPLAVLNGYLLYLTLSEKGKRVLSAEYHSVIRATQHTFRTRSTLTVVLVAVVFVLIAGMRILLAVIELP
jgi:hypothetical protein